MPELPEVETVRVTLQQQLTNVSIKSIDVRWDNIIAKPSVEKFKQALTDEKFLDFQRRGKYLIFVMQHCRWVAHLRMEGKFFLYDHVPVFNKHQHVIFELDNGSYLVYQDTRKFGKMYVYLHDELLDCLEAMGKEFFDKDMSVAYLKQCIGKKQIALKTFLLDQHLILGVGNIYADEICFLMQRHPRTLMHELSDKELNQLIRVGCEVLDKAIKAGGTTIRSYQSALAVDGRFQLQLMVHQRQHEACKVCGTKIIKEQFNGRGTYYCPWCQPLSYHRIAVTGVMGSGKSTVMQYLQQCYPILSSDHMVDQLLQTNAVKQEVMNALSIELGNDHQANKQLLAQQVFNNIKSKAALEDILHPLVKKTIMEVSAQLVFVEVPLLFEVGWQAMFDAVIVVSAPAPIRQSRLLSRGMSLQQQELRNKQQLSQHQKIAKATFIIDNSGDIMSVHQQIDEILRIIRGKHYVTG